MSKNIFHKKYSWELLLLLIFTIFVTLSLTWKSIFFSTYDMQPPDWDEAVHLTNAYEYLHMMETHDWQSVREKYLFYPPLMYVVMIIFSAGNITKTAVVIINTFFICLSGCALSLLVIKRNTQAYVLKVGYVVLAYLIFALSFLPTTVFKLDLPISSFIMIAVVYILYLIEHKQYSILQSVVLALLTSLITLTKWSGSLYLVAPIGLYWIFSLKVNPFWKTALHLAVYILLCYKLNHWYVVNFDLILHDSLFYSSSLVDFEKDPQHLEGLFFYLQQFISQIFIVVIPFLVANISLHIPMLRKLLISSSHPVAAFRLKYYLISVVFGMLLFSFIPNKDSRYIFPAILMSAAFILLRIATQFTLPVLKITSLSIVSIYLVTHFFSIPKLQVEAHAFHTLDTFLKENKPKLTAYFFEYDLQTINYGTVDLLHKKYGLQNKFINRNDPSFDDTYLYACNLFSTPSAIVVISSIQNLDTRSARFDELCENNSYIETCQVASEHRLTNSDLLRILSCQSGNNELLDNSGSLQWGKGLPR